MFGIREIDAQQLSELMRQNTDEFLLVDVRSPAETAQGMLPGALQVPMHLVPLKLDQWRETHKVIFYCRTGARSGRVCEFLQQQGIDGAINLRGGIIDWHQRGLPIDVPSAEKQVS